MELHVKLYYIDFVIKLVVPCQGGVIALCLKTRRNDIVIQREEKSSQVEEILLRSS